jgi:hypothetical protein
MDPSPRTGRRHRELVGGRGLNRFFPRTAGSRPRLPGVVLPLCGYNEEDATEGFAGCGLTGFIQKPYQLDTPTSDTGEAV